MWRGIKKSLGGYFLGGDEESLGWRGAERRSGRIYSMRPGKAADHSLHDKDVRSPHQLAGRAQPGTLRDNDERR